MRSKNIYVKISWFSASPRLALYLWEAKQNKLLIELWEVLVNPLGCWTGLLVAGKCMHDAKTTSSGYWTGPLAAKQCRVYENLQKRNLFNVLYFDPELIGRIQMSEWVKWQPCRGYGRLLAAVAMPIGLEILSLISWLADLKTVISFHLSKHCWING